MGKDLIEAAKNGDLEKVKKLIQEGAYIDDRGAEGKTALMHACSNEHLDVVQYLLKQGANVELINNHDSQAIHYGYKNVDILKELLKYGADINYQDYYGNTPLHLTISFHKINVAKYIINNTDANLNIKDKGNYAPILIAVSKGNVEIVRELIKKGALISIQNDSGHTPLHYASGDGSISIIKELLKAGSNIDAPDFSGHTPLMQAVYGCRLTAVKLLLEKGANINLQTYKYKATALHKAVEDNNVAMVQVLVKFGARQDIKDCYGKTPLEYAKDQAVKDVLLNRIKNLNFDKSDTSWISKLSRKTNVPSCKSMHVSI